MPISKVKHITDTRSFSTQNGSFMAFKVVMENGDIGEVLKKEGNKILIGDELDYTIEPTEKYGNKFKLAKKDNFGGKGRFNGSGDSGKPSSFALAYAKDLMVAVIRTTPEFPIDNAVDKTLEIAGKFYDFLKDKDGQVTGSQNNSTQAPSSARSTIAKPENPVAASLEDLITTAQLGALRNIAVAGNIDLEMECKTLLGCKTDELSKRAAEFLITHLQSLRKVA